MPDNAIIRDTKPDIRINKDGVWYYRGREMVRKDIVQALYQHLKRDQDGRYRIEMEGDKAYVDVEDTPYVVMSVSFELSEGNDKDAIYLHMPDDSIDELDPSTLRIGADNVLYGNMARLGFESRFSRSSYYQLAEHIELDAEKDKFYVCLNSRRYYIRTKEDG